ncbi:Very-long-chain (3R)-3-hydroxyacyl-CoA dehydratase 2 [Ananas comosus]|uniref:Very-long-chain (3R)-3-hydroxyacyl-CoA dehydratase n=1 Tax=Ananas comosus TaxID=4615 RepID=A0A199UMK1_ANACO|nr:Very-long-chain (3R)-3-hydroxyacyl-CoA dehydratase 2 [Ananas comosus]
MLRPPQLYLLCYNSLQALGWCPLSLYLSLSLCPNSPHSRSLRLIALARVLGSLFAASSFHGAYASAGELICLLQAVSFLESIHAAVGLVPTGVLVSLMQWGGRTHFLLAIVRQIPEVQSHPSVFITFTAWCMSEVIRYSHYALSCIRICPWWLTYLRYTAFIFLYPIGVAPGEMWLMYEALPFVKERNLYSNFFNKFPISYYSFLVFVTNNLSHLLHQALLMCYPVLWLKLYLHLFKQRRSKLGRQQRKKQL